MTYVGTIYTMRPSQQKQLAAKRRERRHKRQAHKAETAQSDPNPVDSVVDTVVRALAGHRSMCLVASALIHEILNSKGVVSTLCKGYLLLPKEQLVWHHVWLNVNGQAVDAGTKIFLNTVKAAGINLGVSSASFITSTEIPSNFEMFDEDTALPSAWEFYQQNPSEYWQGAPDELRIMRDKLLNSVPLSLARA